MRRESKLAVAEEPATNYAAPKYLCRQNYTAPTTVVESGIIQFVGYEQAEQNKFVGGKGWFYSAVAIPKTEPQTCDRPAFAPTFVVRESEADQWQIKETDPLGTGIREAVMQPPEKE